MKSYTYCLLVMVFLSSCAQPPAAIEQPVFDSPTPQDAHNPGLIEDAVIQRLSDNLGLQKSDISVLRSEGAEFGDACMDIAFPDVMCAQVMTPGRVITLEANGIAYEYHTSMDGDFIQPATFALVWTREGGIAGFCDRLTVFLSGEVYGTNCRSQPKEIASNFAALLSVSEQKQFNTWFLKFGDVNLDVSDPQGVSDRMMNTVVFYGNGSSKPSETDTQTLFEWAQSLHQKLYS